MAQRKREEKRHLSSFVASFLLPPPSSVGLRVPGGNRRQRRRGFSRPLLLCSVSLQTTRGRREGPFFPSFPLSLSRSLSREGGKNTHSDGGEKREKNGLREGRSNTLCSSEMKVGLFVCTTPTQSPSSLSPGAASDASRNLLPPSSSSSSSFSSGRRENGMEWGGEPVQSPERPQRRRKRGLSDNGGGELQSAPPPPVRPFASDRQTVAPSVGRRKTTFCILFVRPLLLDPWQVAADERLSCEKDPSTM